MDESHSKRMVRPSTELARLREVLRVLKKSHYLEPRCETPEKTSHGVTSIVEAGRPARGSFAQRLFWSCHIAPFSSIQIVPEGFRQAAAGADVFSPCCSQFAR